jgi:hypothetical protein
MVSNQHIDTSMNDILLKSLIKFYSQGNRIDKLLDILKYKKSVSLRLIDWFTTNFSKKYNIFYIIYKDDSDTKTLVKHPTIHSQFNVYSSYKSQLKAYSKKRFDPFCRRERLDIEIKGHTINTTVGQLNFFKWILNHNIIDYIEENVHLIEEDMNQSLKEIKKNYNKVDNVRKPRQELSKSALKGLNKTPLKVSITFD